jgi:sorbitol-specific phosphotransferase system component IIA
MSIEYTFELAIMVTVGTVVQSDMTAIGEIRRSTLVDTVVVLRKFDTGKRISTYSITHNSGKVKLTHP